jgi:hypothetical protein
MKAAVLQACKVNIPGILESHRGQGESMCPDSAEEVFHIMQVT